MTKRGVRAASASRRSASSGFAKRAFTTVACKPLAREDLGGLEGGGDGLPVRDDHEIVAFAQRF